MSVFQCKSSVVSYRIVSKGTCSASDRAHWRCWRNDLQPRASTCSSRKSRRRIFRRSMQRKWICNVKTCRRKKKIKYSTFFMSPCTFGKHNNSPERCRINAFCHASPTVWNSLPQTVISGLTVTTGTFKNRLKSALYTVVLSCSDS